MDVLARTILHVLFEYFEQTELPIVALPAEALRPAEQLPYYLSLFGALQSMPVLAAEPGEEEEEEDTLEADDQNLTKPRRLIVVVHNWLALTASPYGWELLRLWISTPYHNVRWVFAESKLPPKDSVLYIREMRCKHVQVPPLGHTARTLGSVGTERQLSPEEVSSPPSVWQLLVDGVRSRTQGVLLPNRSEIETDLWSVMQKILLAIVQTEEGSTLLDIVETVEETLAVVMVAVDFIMSPHDGLHFCTGRILSHRSRLPLLYMDGCHKLRYLYTGCRKYMRQLDWEYKVIPALQRYRLVNLLWREYVDEEGQTRHLAPARVEEEVPRQLCQARFWSDLQVRCTLIHKTVILI